MWIKHQGLSADGRAKAGAQCCSSPGGPGVIVSRCCRRLATCQAGPVKDDVHLTIEEPQAKGHWHGDEVGILGGGMFCEEVPNI